MLPPISFSTLACPDWSWDEILERGRDYGYDGVEIRLIERDTDLLARPEFAPAVRAARRRELDAAGFRVCGLASSVRFDSPDPAERARQTETGLATITLARALGARFVRVFGDVLPEGPAAARRVTLDAIAHGLNTLGEAGREAGVDVLLETHGDFADSRLAIELFSRVTTQGAGILWDTHHPWRFCGESLAETWSRLKPHCRHTHWKDSLAEALDHEPTPEEQAAEATARQLMSGHRTAHYALLGEGEFPVRACLELLAAGGYRGWLSYEWEKAWHPHLAPPEIALPPFPGRMRKMWQSVRE